MEKILNWVIMTKEEHKNLVDELVRSLSHESMMKETAKDKEIERLKKEHSRYIRKWFLIEGDSEEPMVCQITGIIANYRNDYFFIAHIQNLEDSIELDIEDVVEGKIRQLTKKEVIKHLGLD
ncbi:MAG: hypothetical protein KAS32_31435 [Candidatus Peribacteraceae bacterium]|nr:hypothetical protein [Candidatus Peribacteraceae bacterium]